jgi:hypothetical protein
MQAATTPTRQPKKPKFVIESSSDESLSEDDVKTPSPLKYIESNTSLSELPPKACELLDVITTSKQLVKYVKLVSKNSREALYRLFFNEILFFTVWLKQINPRCRWCCFEASDSSSLVIIIELARIG